VLAPAALSLITVTFTEGRERARAFGVYGAISGGGAALGLIVGGLLTEYASWRWCLLLNVPIALVAALAAIPVVQESRSGGGVGYDIMGAVTVTIGLVGLVYGFTRAAQDGWDTAGTVLVVAVAVVLLVAFVVTEVRSAAPLLPMRVPLERNRGGAYLASLLIGASLLALFLFLTFYFQQTLGYSALRTGFAFLPLSLGVMASSGLSSYLLPRVGPRPLMAGGAAAMTAGLLMLTRIDVDTGYLSRVLPAEIVISIGMGLGFVPMSSSSLIGVDPQDAGVASALVNTTQQVGGSLGTALLNTIYATAATGYLKDHSSDSRGVTESQVTGYTTAFTWSAALIGIAFVVILLLVGSGKDLTAARKEPMHAS
ncbi:MFS transporter, partial [Frankia sp. KB5]|uniref:MFS transporter n=1 Tax=Frankia sp. KB5 TaxID=683318 RepID=UPI000A247DBA